MESANWRFIFGTLSITLIQGVQEMGVLNQCRDVQDIQLPNRPLEDGLAQMPSESRAEQESIRFWNERIGGSCGERMACGVV